MRDRWTREVWELVHRAESIALVSGHPSVGKTAVEKSIRNRDPGTSPWLA